MEVEKEVEELMSTQMRTLMWKAAMSRVLDVRKDDILNSAKKSE